MKTDKLLFGIGGLLIGAVIGFLFANSVNRSTSASREVAGSSEISTNQNPMLPPDHPPLTQSDGASQGGALPEVTAAIEKARRLPNDFEAQMTAGDLFYQIQRFDEATDFYKKANVLRPGETEPMIKLGNTNFDAERYEEAERWYAAVLKRTPNDVGVRTDLGLTFFLRKPRELDRAIKEFNTALGLQPDSEIALQNLALAYTEKDDKVDLQKTLDRLAKVNPDNPVLLKNRPK